jgi:hypothetical protein
MSFEVRQLKKTTLILIWLKYNRDTRKRVPLNRQIFIQYSVQVAVLILTYGQATF